MTIQYGKKENYSVGGDYYERSQYDVIVKTEGNYTETLINNSYYEMGMVVDGANVPDIQTALDISYKIYPNMTVEAALVAHGIAVYPWSVPLAEV